MKKPVSFLPCCTAYLLGLLITLAVVQLPSAVAVWSIGFAGCASVISGRFIRVGICYFGFLLLGIFTGFLHGLALQKHWLPERFLGKDLVLSGYVEGLPHSAEGLARFRFVITPSDKPELQGKSLWLSWYNAPLMQAGESWKLTIRLKHPRGSFSDGAFDREAWAAREGIHAVGYVKDGVFAGHCESGWRGYRDRIRSHIRLLVESTVSESSAALLGALLVGDKSLITQSQWQLFNLTGTTHLIVISGLHIGLMALLGYWVVRWFGLSGLLPLSRWPAPRLAALLSLMMAVGYALLAGFGVPVQRALVMTGVALSVPAFGVKPRPLTLFLLALAVVLTLEPLTITSPGFWYSFSAVAILLYGSCGRIAQNAMTSPAARWLKPQLFVFLMLCPMLMFNHQQVTLLAPLINLIAIPLIGLIVVPLAFLALLVSPLVPLLSKLILGFLDKGLTEYLKILQWLADIGWELPLLSADWPVLCFTVLAVLLMFSPAALGVRVLSLFFIMPWLLAIKKLPEEAEAQVVFLDIGQGLSVLVRTRNHALLYDTAGASRGRFSPAESIVLPYLHRHRVFNLDRIMMSHGDSDHAGGLEVIHRRFPGADIFSGSALAAFDQPVSPCLPGHRWVWDQVTFEVLAGSEGSKSNERSCVLKVSARGQSLLLTGDIGKRSEAKLVAKETDLNVTVLLLLHHGSRYSGSDAFLQAVAPEIVVVSAGYKNRFGHPSVQALERVRSTGAETYNTAEAGTLSLLLGTGELKVEGYRQQHPCYWWR